MYCAMELILRAESRRRAWDFFQILANFSYCFRRSENCKSTQKVGQDRKLTLSTPRGIVCDMKSLIFNYFSIIFICNRNEELFPMPFFFLFYQSCNSL